ncbi:zinc finger CHY domain-containing protein [Clohesyomyces aquaticus]|uniref:Zinc finger CHY domain-containing protein n=1 Tax=Clohesyomyces aquaticus TaxID=1231657 RepID=A0A1Y1ZYJ0_9PLEO|nr:zinc finger CHY domain-containing protein [Clohesyomyces aquaticus]
MPPSSTPAKSDLPTVHGESVTSLTQCAHYHSAQDIIAIKHSCCQKFYACISCHNASESDHHNPEVWRKDQRDVKAVLCGACKGLLSVSEYMECGSRCPSCGRGFNPGCRGHWGLYFEVD